MDDITAGDLKQLLVLANRYKFAGPEVQRYLQDGGVIIEPARFYSPIPLLAEIEEAFEYREDSPFSGNGFFDLTVLEGNLRELSFFSKEFDPPIGGDRAQPAGYFWGNGMFSYSDAMSDYSMIRKTKPETIIEVGSGFSTLVAREALSVNGKGRLVCVEPFPRPWLRAMTDLELIEAPAQALEAGFYNDRLMDGDVLFIDSTHSVKIGSDCLHLYLRVLPQIDYSIYVHVHDVFLPYGMPKNWAIDKHIYWTEQYLLLAYLIENERCAFVFGSHLAQRRSPKLLDEFMHGRYPGGGGSFWMYQAAPKGRPKI